MMKFRTHMALVTIGLLGMLCLGTAMDSPANEFGVDDLIRLGVFTAASPTKSRPGIAPPTKFRPGVAPPTAAKSLGTAVDGKQEAFLIAAALVHGRPHGSVPFVTVDIAESGGSCGPYDWIFLSDCQPPTANVRINPSAVDSQVRNGKIYVYQLPKGWGNIRITLPSYGSCGARGQNSRTAFLRIASPSSLCMKAGFSRRSCSFWRCTYKNCDTLYMLGRLLSADGYDVVTTPYVATDNGIEVCPTSSITSIFEK